MMNRFRSLILALILLSLPMWFGCGGGGAKVQTTTTTQTLGQQLIDLEKAYDQGAMTEKEYKSAKKALLDKYK
jgi:hypothetical protein